MSSGVRVCLSMLSSEAVLDVTLHDNDNEHNDNEPTYQRPEYHPKYLNLVQFFPLRHPVPNHSVYTPGPPSTPVLPQACYQRFAWSPVPEHDTYTPPFEHLLPPIYPRHTRLGRKCIPWRLRFLRNRLPHRKPMAVDLTAWSLEGATAQLGHNAVAVSADLCAAKCGWARCYTRA